MFVILVYSMYFCLAGFFTISLFNITLLLRPIRFKGKEIDINELPNKIRSAYKERVSPKQTVSLARSSFLSLIVWSLAVWAIPRVSEMFVRPQDQEFVEYIAGFKLISIQYILIMGCAILCMSAVEHFHFRTKVLNKFREANMQQIK